MTAVRSRTLVWRLGVTLMLVQVIVVVVFGAYATSRIGQFQRNRTIAELDRLLPLVTARLADDVARDDLARLERETRAISVATGLRLTIIRPDGIVLADSDRDPTDLDDHRYRPEIDAALSSGAGSAVRFSNTLDIDMVYVARRLDRDGMPVAVIRASVPLPEVDAALTQTLRTLALAAVLLLAVTLAAIYLISRRLGTTIARLTDGARRFASGELDHRIPRLAGREFTTLADALNNMAIRLGDQIVEIQSQRAEQRAILQSMSNGMIALDPEQRVLSVNGSGEKLLALDGKASRGRLLQELVREPELNRFVDAALGGDRTRRELALRNGAVRVEAVSEPLLDAEGVQVGLLVLMDDVTQLRRLETIRSDFAANVSHELRTPITNIKGYAETMLDVGTDDAARSREFLEVIRTSADRLEAIIEDLLALARLEQAEAKDTIDRDLTQIAPLVARVARQLEPLRARKEIEVGEDVDPDLRVPCVPQLIEQAVGNLLSNALNYATSGTTVTVTGRVVPEGVEIAVRDEGPGIADAHLPRLFERFYRVDQARSRALGGTGLGLAIVKHIALVHGGRAEVESAVGAGSTFRILLPTS